MAYWPDTGAGVDTQPARKPVQSSIRKYFTEGGLGQAPTVPGGDWFNQMTNEVLNVLEAAGIDPSKTDDDQLLQAIQSISNGEGSYEALRRTYADAGYGLRPKPENFKNGGTLTSATDVLLDESSGKAYSGSGPFPQTVDADTNPSGSPSYTDRSQELLHDDFVRHVVAAPAYVDDYKILNMTDTQAIDAAMAASKHVVFSPRKYTYTKELISIGHTLFGAVGETFATTGTIVEFDISDTPASSFAFRNISKKGFIQNIRFIQKSWNIPLNGMKVDRLISTINTEFSYFNGYGGVLTSIDSLAESCYHTSMKDPAFAYNAKHGLVLGAAANAILIENPRFNWNGSPAYGVKPTVAGNYDGLYSGGKNSEYQGNAFFNDPQGVVLIGGDYSYNSRVGLNLERFFDGAVIGGYGEENLVSDIKIRAMYGSTVANFMAQQTPDVAVPTNDPLNNPMSVLIYPNRIIIRGKSYGNGQLSATSGYYDQIMDTLKAVGSLGTLRMQPLSDGSIRLTRSGGTAIRFHAADVPLVGRFVGLGDGFLDADTATRPAPTIRRAGSVEGDEALVVETTSQFLKLFIANGGAASSAATAMTVPKNSVTGRSINTGGTVNTTGADYAEYMLKADGCGEIAKGAICGVNGHGHLTDRFDEAVSFVIKSTNPSFVGGDTWFTEQSPEVPAAPDEPSQSTKPMHPGEEADAEIIATYNAELAEYEDKLFAYGVAMEAYGDALEAYNAELVALAIAMEESRQRVDRIAFSGQVPCNVYGSEPGDYILPVRNEDGSIGGAYITEPTFEQYRRAIGTVWTVLGDGRALVAVKVS